MELDRHLCEATVETNEGATMRMALIVGIDYYDHGEPLFGCVDDARAVETVFERHGDGSVNFDCQVLAGVGPQRPVDRAELKDRIANLFSADVEIALFYFAGHGHVEVTDGYLLTSDASRGDEGISLSEILTFANSSPAQNKVIVLDSCHSGIAGTPPVGGGLTALSEGLTILTASTAEQYATEEDGKGVFTTLLVDGLRGGAASLTGDITPGSLYAHVDQSLGPWDQRPVFKTNVKRFVSLRRVPPAISLRDLRRLGELFPTADFELPLDPTFEPERTGREEGVLPPDPKNTRIFRVLQRYNRLNLLVPVDAPHMWHAAMQSKSCKLTPLGKHYRNLVAKNRI